MVAATPVSRRQALATVVGVAEEKESEREEQAGVGAVAQAPPTPTVMPLLQLERNNCIYNALHLNFYSSSATEYTSL